MKINIPSTAIMVTEKCTLRCKLCLAYSPYYSSYKTMDIEQAKMTLNTYFQMVDTVNKISITGGEPLLNGDLGEIIREIYKYENQILDEIIMVTNGTILLKETLLQILKCNPKVKVIINNYGEISKYAEQNYQDLKKWDIRSVLYDENNRYGWIDCRNHDLKHKTERDKEVCD